MQQLYLYQSDPDADSANVRAIALERVFQFIQTGAYILVDRVNGTGVAVSGRIGAAGVRQGRIGVHVAPVAVAIHSTTFQLLT